MDACIFCRIASGELQSAKIWEDEEFLAILDNQPNTKGMTLVISKKHYPSYVFDMPNETLTSMMLASKTVAKILEKGLKVPRVTMVMEGLGIDHAHIKLYPLHGLEKKFVETWAADRVFFNKYEGYISTQLGPRADPKELEELAQKIRTEAGI